MAGKKAEKLGEDWASLVPEEGWQEEATGFDPYWTPELGKTFRAMVIDIDDKDSDFIRYRMQNAGDEAIVCQRGPASDAEEIEVQPGEHFTCSAYASLPLNQFYGIEVRVVVYENRKLPGNEQSFNKPRDLWLFKVLVSPEDKKALADMRRAGAMQLREAAQQAKLNRLTVGTSPNGQRKQLKNTESGSVIT